MQDHKSWFSIKSVVQVTARQYRSEILSVVFSKRYNIHAIIENIEFFRRCSFQKGPPTSFSPVTSTDV